MGKFGVTSNGNKEELSLTASDKDRAKPKKISSTECTTLVAGMAEPVGWWGGRGALPFHILADQLTGGQIIPPTLVIAPPPPRFSELPPFLG